MKPFYTLLKRSFLLYVAILLWYGCSLEKKSGFNRAMQNLTAHYNILFDANQILIQKQDAYALSYVDNYNDILKVYRDTIPKSNTPDKQLDSVKIKANAIIGTKEQSHYIGDAYLLLGKANYLEANYFNALEYFSYDIRSFPDEPELVQEARVWKARTLMYLKKMPEAKALLDTAVININPKKNITGDVYATLLQYDINAEQYPAAEDAATKAISFCHVKKQRLRLTFILAQVQEMNGKAADAYNNYSHIVNSDASFEMAFNAGLNRIRISENRQGISKSRLDQLLDLLKNQNNKEFTDQIYYQIGELYAGKNDLDNAIKYYKLSVRKSLRNNMQKGLSYLRIADINFKNKADYITAQKYYDSTVSALPPTYPGYAQLKKKSENLALLTNKLQIISREDTLQMLAGLNEADRKTHIDAMVNAYILNLKAAAANAAANVNSYPGESNTGAGAVGGKSNFYFYNSQAISQGLSDFKKRWGSRRLEDNWRRSAQSNLVSANAAATNNNFASQGIDPDNVAAGKPLKDAQQITADNYRRQIMDGLPLTPQRMQQSNDRIFNAYIDIANFYRDVLNDRQEAIATYQLILKRFPKTAERPAIYYNLYRLFSETNDLAKANDYKGLLLRDFPETPFAKVILDPEYARRANDQDAEFDGLYDKVFDLYAGRKYKQVITDADALLKQYPDNKFAAQLAYLKAMAAGHDEKLPPFQAGLQNIATKYPNDHLIGPLVNQHLSYINANLAEMQNRPVVLTDDTANNPLYIPQTATPAYPQNQVIRSPQLNKPAQSVTNLPATSNRQINAAPVTANQLIVNQPVVTKPAMPVEENTSSIFSLRDSTNFLFVVNVSVGDINLASSRFGIGQFARANYAGQNIRHQLKPLGNDTQLIWVGRFYSLNAVKEFARAIIPLMPDIMKVPKDKYSFFIITKENLDKLADKKALDSYIDYYQKNYLK